MTRTMKAAVVRAFGKNLAIEDVPIPEPGPPLPEDQQRAIQENARWWREWLASKGWSQ